MKDDGVHENFFTVPELPHKKMEREAILLLQKIINSWVHETGSIQFIIEQNKDLVDWVMKYKGK